LLRRSGLTYAPEPDSHAELPHVHRTLNADADAWLAGIVESSDDAIIGKTLDSTIRSWNSGAERIFGYTAPEAIGRSIRMLIPADLQDQEDMILSRLRRGERIEHFETVRQRKDGTCVDVSLSVSPIRSRTGEIIGAAKIARDVSETKRLLTTERELTAQLQDQAIELEQQIEQSQGLQIELEQQLEESQALQTELEEANEALNRALLIAERATSDAEQANRAKSHFLAMMSHELRTPLNAILGYVELLEIGVDGAVNATQQAHLGRIRTSGRMLLRLIEDVLDFAKLESGRLTFHITDVLVNDVMLPLQTFVEPQLARRGVEYRAHPCPADLIVRGDSDKIEQILLNLVSNAVKFTESGSIDVRCHGTEKDVRIEVMDTGRGIPADMLDTIFEPFVQGEQDLTRTIPGTGLGLSISRQFARGMGADITVDSTVGVGSRFTLILPRPG
jgi:PAS domain S-box-containing protein